VPSDELAGFEGERSVAVFDRTLCLALGTRMHAGECLGLLVQESRDGAFRHTSGDQGGELLNGREGHEWGGAGLGTNPLCAAVSPHWTANSRS